MSERLYHVGFGRDDLPVGTSLALLSGVLVIGGLLTYVVASVAGQWQKLSDQFATGTDQIFEFLENGPLPFSITVDDMRADDISVMLYTSGTTGRPKGVPRTHSAEHHAALAHLVQTGHGPGEASLGVMPLFHTMGLRTLLASEEFRDAAAWLARLRVGG